MLQPKATGWLIGYKNKTHIYAVQKRTISDLGTQTYEGEGVENEIPHKWKSKES